MVTLRSCCLSAIVLAALPASACFAQVVTGVASGAQSYFASQGNGYTAADPAGGFPTAGPPVPGPTYSIGSPLPNLPALGVPPLYPAAPGANAFAGGGYTATFNDGAPGTAATKSTLHIDDSIAASPTLTSDVSILFLNWGFSQGPTATGHAYHQVNFVSQYSVTGGALGGSAPSLPLFINGQVSPGGTPFAQFDAAIDYTWIDINSDGTTGAVTPLGTLNYTYTQLSAAPFSTVIFSTGALLGTPSGNGVLELSGYAYIAGDPFDLNVSVPEPASLAVLALGAVALIRRRR